MNKRRQIILVGALVALVAAFGGEWAWKHGVEGPIDAREAKIDRAKKEIAKREADLRRAAEAAEALETWEARSLPSDPALARSLYQNWLVELVRHARFTGAGVDAGEPAGRKGELRSIAFSVRGRGDLEQLSRFLFQFYRAGHLHQLRSLSITPAQGGLLDLAIQIDALILPGATRADRLGDEQIAGTAYPSLADYRPIAQRNLFGVSVAVDAAQHTYLTAINRVDGVPEAWFTCRGGGRLEAAAADAAGPRDCVRLRPGEALRVGGFAGTLVLIDESDVVLEAAGQRWLLSIGESLAAASPLPPGL